MDRDFTGLNKDQLIELLQQRDQDNSSLQKQVKTLSQNVQTLSDDVRILKRYLYG